MVRLAEGACGWSLLLVVVVVFIVIRRLDGGVATDAPEDGDCLTVLAYSFAIQSHLEQLS